MNGIYKEMNVEFEDKTDYVLDTSDKLSTTYYKDKKRIKHHEDS